MPDTGKLAKLIERRKRQEKQNDRVRIHKNKLDNMRLEKLSNFFDWSKNLIKQEHLNTEAKCIGNLEKLYERQSKIEDEKKARERQEKEEEERYKKALGLNNPASSDGKSDQDIQAVSSTPPSRRRVTSASKQEQAKNFMNKAKSLSSGYRDNDPPQSYYKRKGIVPPDRVVDPEISYSAQAQTGGGFFIPPSALHVRDLKKWQGIPEETVTHVAAPPNDEPPGKKSPPPERPFSLFEALKALDDDGGLEILREEDESSFGEISPRSSMSTSDVEDEIDQVRRVNIRPSTAPGTRMGLMQSVMTNVENEVLIRKLNEKARCLAEERQRRMLLQRAQSAPAGGRRIQIEENYPSLRRLSLSHRETWNDNPHKKDKGQKALIEANLSYSDKLNARVKGFLRP